ncbi:unnamed protein product, partial [Mesorhabditis belari]|uniref:Calcineurin-like phosphoesterase domain-containing protein n=1 Tax=Mesorhabditis belari TaxID=2138241 RepID=A0AAF3JC73_9BILA
MPFYVERKKGECKNNQTKLWRSVEHNYTVIPIELDEENAANSRPKSGRYLKFVVLSDTHCKMEEIMDQIPDGDVLVHCGDFTNFGEYDKISEFNDQLGRLPHKYKIVIAGNHELGFEDGEDVLRRTPEMQTHGTPRGYKLLTNATYLHDSSIQIENLKLYGSSWHPLRGYSFHVERGPEMMEKWKQIPKDTDILITHGPPLGYNDARDPEIFWGDFDLLKIVTARKPKYHLHGHMHEGYGVCSNGETTFINSAIADKRGNLARKPIIFYIPLP